MTAPPTEPTWTGGAVAIWWVFLGGLAGFLVFVELVLRDRDEWDGRPAAALAFAVTLGGPASLAVVILRALWRAARELVRGFGDIAEMRRERRLQLHRETREQAVSARAAEIEAWKAQVKAREAAERRRAAERAARRTR